MGLYSGPSRPSSCPPFWVLVSTIWRNLRPHHGRDVEYRGDRGTLAPTPIEASLGGERALSTIPAEIVDAGAHAGTGSFVCLDCGFGVALRESDELPECPGCGGERFRRASLFEGPSDSPTSEALRLPEREETPEWLTALRHRHEEEGAFLAFMDGSNVSVLELREGWMRIGRSRSADLRLDHPTVSRRHAIVVRTEQNRVRALDDRSLNGLYVNGKNVEWSPLADGDELRIGRYSLYLLSR